VLQLGSCASAAATGSLLSYRPQECSSTSLSCGNGCSMPSWLLWVVVPPLQPLPLPLPLLLLSLLPFPPLPLPLLLLLLLLVPTLGPRSTLSYTPALNRPVNVIS
jgi:hypothetical protein